MILLTITIEETEGLLKSQGVASGIRATESEDELAKGLLKAIETYCTEKRAVSGSVFIRRDPPTKKQG